MPNGCFSTVGGVAGLDNLSQNILYYVHKNRNSTSKGKYVQIISLSSYQLSNRKEILHRTYAKHALGYYVILVTKYNQQASVSY